MGFINDLKDRITGQSEEDRTSRYTCNTCDTQFSEADSVSDVTCPECGDEQMVFRL